MTLVEKLAKNVVRLRAKKKLTQRQVADRAGVTVSMVSMVESGNRSPSLDTVQGLMAAFGVKKAGALLD